MVHASMRLKLEDIRNIKKIIDATDAKNRTEAVQKALKNYVEVLENQDFY